MATGSAVTSKDPAPKWVVPGLRPASEVNFEEGTVAFYVDAAELLGVPKSVAAIYGIIFASSAPLSFSDITTRLNFSSGSISQGLKFLKEIGAIKSQPNDKDKLERFVPDLELRKLITRFMEHRLEKQLNSGSVKLERLLKAVPTEDSQAADKLKLRLKSLTDWHTRARQLLPVAKVFLKLTN